MAPRLNRDYLQSNDWDCAVLALLAELLKVLLNTDQLRSRCGSENQRGAKFAPTLTPGLASSETILITRPYSLSPTSRIVLPITLICFLGFWG